MIRFDETVFSLWFLTLIATAATLAAWKVNHPRFLLMALLTGLLALTAIIARFREYRATVKTLRAHGYRARRRRR